ncbi:uncharacterized protein C8Q71DRAFT_747431 [Rhodofomes roseus]|uniref:Small secreted protein n=1 Tax=Rhodofomes roseus TaxID=34475 RepID=A0A4Y9Y5P5_9APHY|nr:uncharacterized protein C8Q71DRAFT_747431 [Rhodofomes roseus]KAH9839057.1 hypothetical protein C8Q71DRAFT_747431 [Rhodofomes roseus]TFY57472.1 hypothetical protein EVJ58_g6999 [Rhodofomes roseus]
MARLSFIALIACVVAFVGVQAAPVPSDVGIYIRHGKGKSAKSASASATASSAASTASAASSAAASNSTASTSGGSAFVAGSFQAQDYAAFQISSGTGGDAEAEANAVFVDPFANVDLSTVDDATVETMTTMREAAESAETDDFNPQIAAASGDAADALQVGKIKNKVLKLTGEVQVLNIKIAKAQATGDDTSDLESSLAAEQKKLSTNIATDQDSAGKTSQGVA